MVSYAKIYLNGSWWLVQISYFCLIISWRINCPHLDIRNIKFINNLVYLINLKIECDCLTGIVTNFTNLGNDSQLTQAILVVSCAVAVRN